MLSKIKNLKQVAENAVQEHLYKEHCIPLPDSMINLLLEKNLDKISEMAGTCITRLQLASKPGHLTLSGNARPRGVNAKFSIDLEFLPPIWEPENHRVCLNVLANSLDIDNSGMRGLLASIGVALFGALTGKDYFNYKVQGIANGEGVIEVPLDNLDDNLDKAIQNLELKKMDPAEGKVKVVAKVRDGTLGDAVRRICS